MEREAWMDWNPRFRDPDEETLKKMRKSVEDFEKETGYKADII